MSCDSENRLYCFSNFAIVDPPDETEVCSQELCEMDTDLAEQCEDFLTVCLPNEPTEDCIAVALLICREINVF